MGGTEMIMRPNGKPYRPRKVVACAVANEDQILSGVMILGTHDVARAQPLADQYAAWQLDAGYAAAKPLEGWYREGFESGQFRWITDEVRGRAGVWFREIVEVPPALGEAQGDPQ
jgi:hypothetical protein